MTSQGYPAVRYIVPVLLAAACAAAEPGPAPGAPEPAPAPPGVAGAASVPAAPATSPTAPASATAERADLAKLVRLGLQDGLITCSTAHAVTDGPRALEVEGHAGAQLTVFNVGPAGRQSQSVRLVVRDVVAGGEVSTTLQGSPATFSLSRDIVLLPREMSIQYIQSPFGAEDGNTVRLYLQGFSDEAPREKAVFPARDFPAFIRTHLEATDNYLRPMLEAVGDPSGLFEVPPSLGAEVLADRLTPDEATRGKVMQLVAKLDADDPKDRNAAQQELQQQGQPAVAVLRQLDRSKLSLEQAARVETLLAAAAPAAGVEASKLRGNTQFLLDCLTCSDANVARAALEELKAKLQRPLALDLQAPAGQLREAVRALRRELSAAGATTRPATGTMPAAAAAMPRAAEGAARP